MADFLVAAVALVWVGCLASVALALRDGAAPAQRREARLALSVGAVLPLCVAVTSLRDVTRRTLVDGAAELGRQIVEGLRWLFSLSRGDALWVLERAWRVVVFVMIIGIAIALVLGSLWALLWFLRLSFNALNLVFQWTRIPWVLPEVEPPSWSLSADRGRQAAVGWQALRDRVVPREGSSTTAGEAWRARTSRGNDLNSRESEGFEGATRSDALHGKDTWCEGTVGGPSELVGAVIGDSTGAESVEGDPQRAASRLDPLRSPEVAGVPPLPPLPSLNAEGRFRMSTAFLDLRPVTGIPRLDRRWLEPVGTPSQADQPEKAPPA